MPDLQHLLDQIDRLDQQATRSPWGVFKHDYYEVGPLEDDEGEVVMSYDVAALADQPDAEFIALARTALPTLAKALREVKAVVARIRENYTDYNATDLIALTIADDIDHAIYDAMEDQ